MGKTIGLTSFLPYGYNTLHGNLKIDLGIRDPPFANNEQWRLAMASQTKTRIDKLLESDSALGAVVIVALISTGGVAYGYWSLAGIACSAGAYFECGLAVIPALLASGAICLAIGAILMLYLLFSTLGDEENEDDTGYFPPPTSRPT